MRLDNFWNKCHSSFEIIFWFYRLLVLHFLQFIISLSSKLNIYLFLFVEVIVWAYFFCCFGFDLDLWLTFSITRLWQLQQWRSFQTFLTEGTISLSLFLSSKTPEVDFWILSGNAERGRFGFFWGVLTFFSIIMLNGATIGSLVTVYIKRTLNAVFHINILIIFK